MASVVNGQWKLLFGPFQLLFKLISQWQSNEIVIKESLDCNAHEMLALPRRATRSKSLPHSILIE